MTDFISTKKFLPQEGEVVDWISPCGNQVNGGVKGPRKLWLLPPDWAVYCYYEPIAWRPHKSKEPTR